MVSELASSDLRDHRITVFGLFAEAYTGLVARFTEQLAPHGLSLVEFEVLLRLGRSPGHLLRMNQLAGQVALTTSGLTRVVDRLERAGLVSRQACPDDRRGLWAVLTEPGMARLTAALPGHLALLERHFAGRFRPEELAVMVARLREIRDDVHPAANPDGAKPDGADPAGANPDGADPDERGNTGRIARAGRTK